MSAWLGLTMLIAVALFLLFRAGGGDIGGLEPGDFVNLIAGLALLIFIGGGTLAAYRGQGAKAIKDAAIWLGVILVLITLYSFRNDFRMLGRRLAGELMPGFHSRSWSDGGGHFMVEIRARDDGHFATRAHINGADINMVVDTGASGVVLTSDDARKIGIDPAMLSYSIPVRTAHGLAKVALVRLDAISVGEIRIANVIAYIARPGDLDESLLGMSFLSRLSSYEVQNGVLILRQ